MKHTLNPFFLAENHSLETAKKDAKRARTTATIKSKTAKKPETIIKYNDRATRAEKSLAEIQLRYDTLVFSPPYNYYNVADKLAIRAVKTLATGTGAGADLARDIMATGYNHDIYISALQSLTGEVWIHSGHFRYGNWGDPCSETLDAKLKHDTQWLGLTFDDYVYAPITRGKNKDVYRWYSPTRNHLMGFVTRYLRAEGNVTLATSDVGEQTANDTILSTPDLTNAIDTFIDSSTFASFLDTLTPDQRTIIDWYTQGYKLTEIADKLGVTKSAITQRWYTLADKYRAYLNAAYIG